MGKSYVKRDLTVGKDYVEDGGGGAIYTTGETAIGAYKDKTLYGRIFHISNLPAVPNWVPLIVDTDIETLVSVKTVGDHTVYYQLANSEPRFSVQNGRLSYYTSTDYNHSTDLVIEYTKVE